MVCKEDVFAWFTRLKAPRRIEVLASLLHMCLPLELRFVGSCVENLAKRNFVFLREAENQANSVSEIDRLRDLTDDTVRSRINVYLALLYSTNVQCSNVLYDILSTCVETAIPKLSMDEGIANELLLMLTVAVNHPVFTFEQREVLSTHLGNLVRLLEEYIQEEESSKDVSCQAGEGSTSRVRCEDVRWKDACCQAGSTRHLDSENGFTKDAWCQTGESVFLFEPAFVQAIKVQGSQRRTEKEHEFCMQVTWSNGEVTAVNKTYQELYEFHTTLLKAFPDDAGAHRHERKIPYLPGIRHLQRNHREEVLKALLPSIQEYAENLVKVPEYILHSSYLQVFFKPEQQNVTVANPLSEGFFSRNRGERLNADRSWHSSIGSSSSRQNFNADADFRDEVHPATEYVRSATIYNSKHADVGGRRIAEHHMGGIAGMVKDRSIVPTVAATTSNIYQRAAYTTGSVSTFPLNSALPSPLSSPFTSPSTVPATDHVINPQQEYQQQQLPVKQQQQQQQQHPQFTLHCEDVTVDGKTSVSDWLKSFRLHKYNDQLAKYSFSDLLSMTDEDLEEKGLTRGAICKLRKELQRVVSMVPGPNGMIVVDTGCPQRSSSPSSPSSPLSPSSYHTPPCHSPHLGVPLSSRSCNMTQATPGGCYNNLPHNSSVDSSPTCSEYSSPPPSPSIEEEDRDNSNGKMKERSPHQHSGFVPIPRGGVIESLIPGNGQAEPHLPGNGLVESRVPVCGPIPAHIQAPGVVVGSDVSANVVMEPRHIPMGDPQQVLLNGGLPRPMYHMESGQIIHKPRLPIICPMRPIMKPTPVIPGRLVSQRTPLSAPIPVHVATAGTPGGENSVTTTPGIHDYPTATSDVITVATSTLASMNTHVTTISSSTVSIPSLQGVSAAGGLMFSLNENLGQCRDTSSPVLHAAAAHNYQPPPPLVSADSASLVQTSQHQPKMACVPPSSSSSSEGVGTGGIGGNNSTGGSSSSNSSHNTGIGLLPTPVHPPLSLGKTPTATTTSNKSSIVFPQQSIRSPAPPTTSSGSGGGGCTQCGCYGNCGSNNNNQQQQHPAPFNYFMVPPLNNTVMHGHLPPGPAPTPPGAAPPGYMPQNPNGVVPPGIHHFGQHLPNGINSPEGLNQYYISMLQAHAMHASNSFINHSNSAPSLNTLQQQQQHHQHHHYHHQQHQRSNNKHSNKTVTCYNCGHQGHKATECKEVTMDSITRSGLQLNYKPSE